MFAAAILLGVIVIVQLVALAWMTTAMERAEDRRVSALERVIESHNAVVANLLQRIQAPEAAVIQHQIVTSPRPDRPAPAFEDDAGFWQSKEELAAQLHNEQ